MLEWIPNSLELFILVQSQLKKLNVDKLKLIQLGIILINDKGEYPPGTCTWQFNLNFDVEEDEYSNESISILYNSGIDFKLMKNKGIHHSLFAEYLLISGLFCLSFKVFNKQSFTKKIKSFYRINKFIFSKFIRY